MRDYLFVGADEQAGKDLLMVVLILAVGGGLLGADSLVAGPVEQVADSYTFTEGPLWLPEGKWIFSDVQRDTIYNADGSVFRKPSRNANGLALDSDGRLIACESAARRITRTEKDGTITVLADQYEGKELNAPNDVVVRSDGGIFFTNPRSTRRGEPSPLGYSAVFFLAPEGGQLRLLSKDFTYPNGVALSPDEKTLYVSDTSGGHIRAFDVAADGTISNGRVLCEVRIPDGIAVDSAGRIWSSSSRGVIVFDASGRQVGRVDFRGMPTNCAFGGAEGKTLYITARKYVYKVRCSQPGL